MHILDLLLAKLALTEIVLKTSLPAHSVIERLDYGMKPILRLGHRSKYFTIEGQWQSNFFKLRAHLTYPDGKDAFPPGVYIGILFFTLPLYLETSPTLYGRVFDEGDAGAVIRGHFAIPFPTLLLALALGLFIAAYISPRWAAFGLMSGFFLISWSLASLVEFFTERKGILDFLQGLFYDVMRK